MPISLALTALSGLLAIVLTTVYFRNHRQVRSPFTIGLTVFAIFLVLHAVITIYTDVTMMATYTAQAEALHLVLAVAELAALATLTWATLR